ncbi:hypothetical protein ACQ4M3_29820 [Leptolyngbya sp. AN03gr2]|uniref:hypothetical protein n=1 Tax=unclassified Leptolyngbya TaxID=2650499 RepID=UPI003D310856
MKKRASLVLMVGASLTVIFGATANEARIIEGVPSTIRSTDWRFQKLKSIALKSVSHLHFLRQFQTS